MLFDFWLAITQYFEANLGKIPISRSHLAIAQPIRGEFTPDFYGTFSQKWTSQNEEQRAIQIGMKDDLSRFYVQSAVSIEDVTSVAHCIAKAHKEAREIGEMDVALPMERPYFPRCCGLAYAGMNTEKTACSILETCKHLNWHFFQAVYVQSDDQGFDWPGFNSIQLLHVFQYTFIRPYEKSFMPFMPFKLAAVYWNEQPLCPSFLTSSHSSSFCKVHWRGVLPPPALSAIHRAAKLWLFRLYRLGMWRTGSLTCRATRPLTPKPDVWTRLSWSLSFGRWPSLLYRSEKKGEYGCHAWSEHDLKSLNGWPLFISRNCQENLHDIFIFGLKTRNTPAGFRIFPRRLCLFRRMGLVVISEICVAWD